MDELRTEHRKDPHRRLLRHTYQEGSGFLFLATRGGRDRPRTDDALSDPSGPAFYTYVHPEPDGIRSAPIGGSLLKDYPARTSMRRPIVLLARFSVSMISDRY